MSNLFFLLRLVSLASSPLTSETHSQAVVLTTTAQAGPYYHLPDVARLHKRIETATCEDTRAAVISMHVQYTKESIKVCDPLRVSPSALTLFRLACAGVREVV